MGLYLIFIIAMLLFIAQMIQIYQICNYIIDCVKHREYTTIV